MSKNSGISHVCKYMKYTSLYIYKYIAGDHSLIIHSNLYDIKVSLTQSGIPRILPIYFRNRIRARDENIIKYVLTICNLYRVLPYPGEVKLSTITDPWNGKLSVKLLTFIPVFFRILGFSKPYTFVWDPFVLSAKGSFSSSLFQEPLTKGKLQKEWRSGNSVSGFLRAAKFLRYNIGLMASIRWFMIDAPQSEGARSKTAFEGLIQVCDLMTLISSSSLKQWGNVPGGRLAFKEEPGKVRVFAMVDCITQWVLHSLHQWLFEILRHIENKFQTDATFDQDKGVRHLQTLLSKYPISYSLDLSAATDRLPLLLQKYLLNFSLPGLGDHWANLLVNRDYSVPSRKGVELPATVRYATGQPMGALSSWAMLALTHHFIVQACANNIYNRNIWFRNYMVLGDDVVILDKKVAKEYLRVMGELNVGVNIAKSLVSGSGYAEFAKRFISATSTLSGLSLKEFSSMHLGWASFLNCIRKNALTLTVVLRTLGYGSKSSGQFRWTNKPEWSMKRWFYETTFAMNSSYDEFFGGRLFSHLCYRLYGWFSTRIKLYDDNKYRFENYNVGVTSTFRELGMILSTDLDAIALRALANRWIDESLLPISMDFIPRKGKLSELHKQVSNPLQLLYMQETFQKIIYKLFFKTKFWDLLAYGRSSDYEKRYSSWLTNNKPEDLGLKEPSDIIRGYLDDPHSLMVIKGMITEDVHLSHLLGTKPSEEFSVQQLKDTSQFSKIISLKSIIWNDWASKFDKLRISRTIRWNVSEILVPLSWKSPYNQRYPYYYNRPRKN